MSPIHESPNLNENNLEPESLDLIHKYPGPGIEIKKPRQSHKSRSIPKSKISDKYMIF